jgi:hypothetical protein
VGFVTRVRVALLAGVLALATAFLAPAALACARGYSYAGLYSPSKASGVAATLTMLEEPNVPSGHVAAWVGVGGPGFGPHGEDEWLQVGLASFPGSAEGHLYYELAQPGYEPRYSELAGGIRPGERQRVALLELPFAHDSWVVVSSAGVAGPFYLPRSHRAWEPIATAESYSAGAACNRYAYRFGGVQLASGNGSWRALRHGRKLQDPGLRLSRHGASTFSAFAA